MIFLRWKNLSKLVWAWKRGMEDEHLDGQVREYTPSTLEVICWFLSLPSLKYDVKGAVAIVIKGEIIYLFVCRMNSCQHRVHSQLNQRAKTCHGDVRNYRLVGRFEILRESVTAWEYRELEKRVKNEWEICESNTELALAAVCPLVRIRLPRRIRSRTWSTDSTGLSLSPTTCTCCFPSSRTRNFALPFNKSKTYADNFRFFFKSWRWEWNIIGAYFSGVNFKKRRRNLEIHVSIGRLQNSLENVDCCQHVNTVSAILILALLAVVTEQYS